MQEILLTEKDASRFLKVSCRTLQYWRSSYFKQKYGSHPLQFIRISKRMVRYRMEDIEEFLKQERIDNVK